jgi:hypothetical protein
MDTGAAEAPTVSGPHADLPGARMPRHLTEHYRGILDAHAYDRTRGTCVRCGQPRCPEWRHAYERLVSTGERADVAVGVPL